jgi:glycosyltransferase involved in cell wall biosynthesis
VSAAASAAQSALERLRSSPRARLLFVSHAFGGGVGRHIGELTHALGDDAEIVWLRPADGGHLVLGWLREGEDLALTLRPAEDEEALVALLQALGISRVHLHHVQGLPRWALALPDRLGSPLDVTLHDYFPACAAYHMTGADGRFCGGEPGCMRCLERGPTQWGLSIDAWRSLFGDLLRRAERVIAPSRDCAERLRRFFPDVVPLVWPHPQAPQASTQAAARILVPGAISPEKGLALLEQCVRDAAARSLPLHFIVIGYVAKPIAQWPELPLTIAGEYPEGRLAELIALARGDALLFPAQCPESFSYTLSAAIASGLPIVATDLGALGERLAGRGNARLVRWDAPASAFNDALVELAVARRAVAAANAQASSIEEYRARYVEPLARVPASGAIPPIPARWQEPPPAKPDDWTLAALYEDGVRCGRSEPRERLGRRAALADRHLAEHKDLVREKDAEIAALESQLAEAKSRLAEVARIRAESERAMSQVAQIEARLRLLERSRSWRITAPLRALMKWLSGSTEERERRS